MSEFSKKNYFFLSWCKSIMLLIIDSITELIKYSITSLSLLYQFIHALFSTLIIQASKMRGFSPHNFLKFEVVIYIGIFACK